MAEEDELVEEEEEVTVVPGWAPAVSLDLQEVPTGEEEEDEIYSQRSKLYRFKDGEWKERGLGESKLLRHRESGKIRYMMRQEKTGKIVANHYVYAYPPYCELKYNSGSDKCWVWTTMDYSEEEMLVEQFALRFKDAELAQQFKEAFDSAKEENAKVCEPGATPEAAEPKKELPAAPAAPAPTPAQPDGNPFAGLSLFGSSGSAPTPPAATGGLFSSLSSSGGLFSSSSGSLFGNSSSSSGIFGGGGSLFGGSSGGGSLFGQPSQADAPAADEQQNQEGELVEEEEVTVVPGWAPTVSLELQEVPTGEEEEDEIYSQRSKLYRFRDGEWKERGLGNSQLLRHRATGKIRYMMRQEKTGKIVANHYVYAFPPYCELKLNTGSDKCWVWTSMDYSEDEPTTEQFALRFKEVELAQQFQEAFNSAKEDNAKVCDGAAGNAKAEKKAVAEDTATRPSATNGNATAGGSPSGATPGGLFSSLTSGASSSGGLFSSSSGSLFGNSSSSSGILGGGGSLFGGSSTGGIFSGIAFQEPKADSPNQSAGKSTEPFSSLSFASGSLLGGSTGGLFGGTGSASSGLFGGNLFGSTSNGIFGSGSLFAPGANTSGGIFGTGGGLFSAASSGSLLGSAGGTGGVASNDEDEWVQAEMEEPEEAYDYDDDYGDYGCEGPDGATNFAALAQQQASSGWRCEGCRLMYGDEVIECSICEMARPGYEEEVAAAKAEKGKGVQTAMAAFLGSGGPSSSGSGFGASTAPATFGVSSGSVFGAPGASAAYQFGSGGASAGAQPDGMSATAKAPSVQTKAAPPAPPAPPVGNQNMYGYPSCGQQYGMPCMMPSMPQMMPGMGMPMGMYGYGPDHAKVEALERSVKELNDQMRELRDAFEVERKERSKVEVTVQFLEKRLQEEESKSSRAESRATAAEAQVEALRRSLERSHPQDDARLIGSLQKNLEEQLAPLRHGIEQKSDESLRLLAKVLEQSRDEPSDLKQRLEVLEARLDRLGHEPTLISMSRPPLDRVAYFQSLHVQQTGRRLANGCEDEPQNSVYLADPKPLLRQIP